jgi:hypothetical protein
MLEILLKGRACPACGASRTVTRWGGESHPEGRGETFLEASGVGGLQRAPRERSGLAYAAGFAGVLYLFRYSLAPLMFSQAGQGWALAVLFMLVWSLLSPAALALSFAAAVSLDRSPQKSGRLPTLFGFCVGWLGLVAWLSHLDERWLTSLVEF